MYTALIADDEAVECSAVNFLLEQHFPNQFEVMEAANGREALTLLQSQKVDVLLSDIQMPFLNGIELAREARILYPDIELLFFSGFDDFEYVQNALLLRAVNYVLKPLDPEQFRQAISEILTRLDARQATSASAAPHYDLTFVQNDPVPEQAGASELSDPALLKRIELAIHLKQPVHLSDLTSELMGRYADSSGRSHLYIRHIAADLLQIIIDGIPEIRFQW